MKDSEAGELRAAMEKIIAPIVEGQIRSFVSDHPNILKGVDWYKPRGDKTTTLVNSLAKRITNDLLCGHTAARLTTVFLELTNGDTADVAGVECLTASAGDRPVTANGSVPYLSESEDADVSSLRGVGGGHGQERNTHG